MEDEFPIAPSGAAFETNVPGIKRLMFPDIPMVSDMIQGVLQSAKSAKFQKFAFSAN